MKTLTKSLIYILIASILYVVSIFIMEFYLEKHLKKEEKLTFSKFNMTFGGNLTFNDLLFENDSIVIQAEAVKLNIGIMKILLGDTILINRATVNHAKLTYFKRTIDSTNIDSTKTVSPKQKNKRPFALKTVDISGFDFLKIEKGDTLTNILGINLKAQLKDIQNIQFKELKQLSFQSLYLRTNELIDITIDSFKYRSNTILVDTFKVFTRYSKEEYIYHIPEQKGHIDLVAYQLILDNVDFKIHMNKLKKISLNEINLEAFELDVYRDKTLPEYTQLEPTYAQIVQGFDFELDINAAIAKNSRVSFSMKTDNEKVSRVDFKDINARLTHINNIPSKKQIAKLTGNFSLCSQSIVDVYLSYNQYAKAETFQMDLHGKSINTKALNSIFRPAMNVDVSGTVDNIDAHMVSKGSADGTVRLQSKDLKIKLYKENGKDHKLLTAIGNAIVNKEIDKTGEVEDFEFDKTRPMWNYMWHFIQEGIKKAII